MRERKRERERERERGGERERAAPVSPSTQCSLKGSRCLYRKRASAGCVDRLFPSESHTRNCVCLPSREEEDYGVVCDFRTRGKLVCEAGGGCARVLPVMEERGGGASVEMSERRGGDNQ